EGDQQGQQPGPPEAPKTATLAVHDYLSRDGLPNGANSAQQPGRQRPDLQTGACGRAGGADGIIDSTETSCKRPGEGARLTKLRAARCATRSAERRSWKPTNQVAGRPRRNTTTFEPGTVSGHASYV